LALPAKIAFLQAGYAQNLLSEVVIALISFKGFQDVVFAIIHPLGTFDAIKGDVEFGAQSPQGGSADK